MNGLGKAFVTSHFLQRLEMVWPGRNFPLLEEQEVVKASGTEKASEVADTKE